jgi:hypothetical protein
MALSAANVDINTVFRITQTTANITMNFSNPTLNATRATIYTLKSDSASTQPFQFYGMTVNPNTTALVLWDGLVFSRIGDPIEDERIESTTAVSYTTTQW